MDKQGKWKLSPAYDLCYSYTPGGKWTNSHQLSLNGKQDNFTMADLQKVGENMGIREHKQIIEEVQETVSHWHEIAKDCEAKPEHADFIEKSQCVVNMEEIGKIIKERRKSLKVNQLELSKLAGVGINTLVAIERGEGNPKLETLLSILERPEHRHLL